MHVGAVFSTSLMYRQQSVTDTAHQVGQLQDSSVVPSSQPCSSTEPLSGPPEKPHTGFVLKAHDRQWS